MPGVHLREIYQLVLGCVQEGQESIGDKQELSPGLKVLVGAIFFVLSQPRQSDTCRSEFWHSPPTLLALCALPFQPAHCDRHISCPREWGANPIYQCTCRCYSCASQLPLEPYPSVCLQQLQTLIPDSKPTRAATRSHSHPHRKSALPTSEPRAGNADHRRQAECWPSLHDVEMTRAY